MLPALRKQGLEPCQCGRLSFYLQQVLSDSWGEEDSLKSERPSETRERLLISLVTTVAELEVSQFSKLWASRYYICQVKISLEAASRTLKET